SRRVRTVPATERLQALGMLHASVAESLATLRERLRVLWAALRPAREAGVLAGRFAELARRVAAEAARLRNRRSIRDQRQPAVTDYPQRLVWVAGEAVCAVPDVAESWPSPAIVSPYYGEEPGTFAVQFPGGQPAMLNRGRSFAPLSRLRAWMRGR